MFSLKFIAIQATRSKSTLDNAFPVGASGIQLNWRSLFYGSSVLWLFRRIKPHIDQVLLFYSSIARTKRFFQLFNVVFLSPTRKVLFNRYTALLRVIIKTYYIFKMEIIRNCMRRTQPLAYYHLRNNSSSSNIIMHRT